MTRTPDDGLTLVMNARGPRFSYLARRCGVTVRLTPMQGQLVLLGLCRPTFSTDDTLNSAYLGDPDSEPDWALSSIRANVCYLNRRLALLNSRMRRLRNGYQQLIEYPMTDYRPTIICDMVERRLVEVPG